MNGSKSADVLGRALVQIRNDLQKLCEEGTGIVFVELSASFIPTFNNVEMQTIAEVHILDIKSGLVTVHQMDFESELGIDENGK